MAIEPVKWGPATPANPRGRKADFVDWIDYELEAALSPHDHLTQQWIKWLELYNAPAKQPERNIPYEKAANFMLPMIAIDADQLYAKFMQTIHATDALWTLSALNERWVNAAKPLQDFLKWLDGQVLHMYNVNKRVLSEMVKLGTGIYKTGWTYEWRKVWTYDDSGRPIQADRYRGVPFVDHVRLPDFVFPSTAYAVDPDAQGGAAWVAERLRPTTARLQWLAESSEPFLPNIDKDAVTKVLHHEEGYVTEYDQAIQAADYDKTAKGGGVDFDSEATPQHHSSSQPASPRVVKQIELWEVHARFPTRSGNSPDDIIVWYHRPTKQVLRPVYQFYHHGRRPYEVVRYFPGDGFYGIGVCQQKEVFQLMQSDLFNFNWDNVLLANSRMVVAKSGQNISPGEAFWPNKVWVVDDDVRSAFGVFPMADIYPSLPQLQQMVQFLGEQRSGIGDVQRGQLHNLPSRTPATTTVSLLEEGNRRPDLTLKDMRYEGLSIVGLRLLQICQQFMANTVEDVGGQRLLRLAVEMLGMPEGQAAFQALGMPMESVEYGLGVTITATSAGANKEVNKQNYMALMQLMGQMSQQILQFTQVAMQAAGTPLGMIAEQSVLSLTELGRRLLEQYDIPNIEDILPTPTLKASPLGGLGQAGAGPGQGAPAAPGLEPGPGGGYPVAPAPQGIPPVPLGP